MSRVTKRVITNIDNSAPYLVRWSVWLLWGWSLKVHQILRADDDRCTHDHPWWMVRIILWGGYRETTSREVNGVTIFRHHHRKPWRPWAPWRIYWCGVKFRHRITELPKGSSWTLALCGSKAREWGFYTLHGFVGWKEFVGMAVGKRVLWCDDGSALNEKESVTCPECLGRGRRDLQVVHASVGPEKPSNMSWSDFVRDLQHCRMCDGTGKVPFEKIDWYARGGEMKAARLLAGYGLRRYAERLGILPSELLDMEAGRTEPFTPSQVAERLRATESP